MVPRVLVICVVVMCVADTALAQTAHSVRIEGTVQAPDGAVLPGATVHIFGTRLTTTTDGEGRYTFAFTHVSARLFLVVDLDNFSGDAMEVTITGPLTTTLDFTLTPSFVSDIVVISELPMLNTADDISRIELSPAQVAVLPSLGERDIFRAFQLLPGVSGSNETSSGLYVRGGTPDQNRIEYDGFRVYDVDHLFGYFSAFNMDAVESVQLSKGGFEAQHGGALSSVMQIAGKSGRLDRSGACSASMARSKRRSSTTRGRRSWPCGGHFKGRSTTRFSISSTTTPPPGHGPASGEGQAGVGVSRRSTPSPLPISTISTARCSSIRPRATSCP